VTKYITASFTPDVAGTYVIALKTAGGVNNSTVTWTVTATGTPAATAAASTVAFYSKAVNGGGGIPGTTPSIKADYEYLRNFGGPVLAIDTALASLVAAAPASDIFSEPVAASNAGDIVGSGIVHFSNKTTVAANTAVAVPMTVAISAHGYVGIGSSPTTYGLTVTETDAAGYTPFGDPTVYGRIKYFTVKSDGTTGPATITVSAGGVVLGTVSMIFTGSKASLALATGTSTKLSKNYIGSSETATVTVNGLDASGNILSASGISAVTSSDTTGTIATAAILGNVVTVTGGSVSGKVTWTVTDGTRTVTFVTNTVKKTAKTVALSLSNTSPAPGEKVTVTITATDSNGSPVANGSRQLFAAGLVTNLSVNGSTCTSNGAVSLVDGSATCSFYAPSTAGTLTISASEGSAVDNVVTNGSTAALTISASLTVVNAAADAAQAAVDAANEATDAANAATDAANNAMDSADAAQQAALDAGDKADAALAAVTDLATKVSAIAAQIAALSALVKKIAAKVKA
jgi:hypothetical protein